MNDKADRITGGLYIAYILASLLADMLGRIGLGDTQQVAQAITTKAGSFRLGLVVAFLSAFLFLVTAWGLYVLLRPVDANLALLFLLLNTVGVAIQCASMLPLIAALLLPAYPAIRYPGLAVSFVAEVGLALWLLVRGSRISNQARSLSMMH